MSTDEKHLASDDVWFRYPKAGDPMPPIGTKLLLLTRGGICIVGQWVADGFFVAWSPMPKRDKAKEAL
jgi:hypothetical protein